MSKNSYQAYPVRKHGRDAGAALVGRAQHTGSVRSTRGAVCGLVELIGNRVPISRGSPPCMIL